MALNCPHCKKPLVQISIHVTSAHQRWTVGETHLYHQETDVVENEEPRCGECTARVGAFLKQHGIYCDWTLGGLTGKY